jgi:GxxExxY protein
VTDFITEKIIGAAIEEGYRIDFLVETEIVVEIKSLEEISAMHHAQLLTYLRLLERRRGLLLNFNVPVLSVGIRRLSL